MQQRTRLSLLLLYAAATVLAGGHADSQACEQDQKIITDRPIFLQGAVQQRRKQEEHVGKKLSGTAGSRVDAALHDTAKRQRPHAQQGVPDMIYFGIFAARCHQVNTMEETVTLDLITTLQWEDSRAIGLDDMPLSLENAKRKMWLPEVDISNRHSPDAYVSTAIMVNESGIVTQTQRSRSVVGQAFNLNAFPFDTQVFTVNISSAMQSAEDIVLVHWDDAQLSGTVADFAREKGFMLNNVSSFTTKEASGHMPRSRGVLRILVQRSASMYVHELLLPSILLLGVCWAVFWLTLCLGMVLPRLVLSTFALIAFMNLAGRIHMELPPGRLLTWSDLYCQNCEWLMLLTLQLSVFTEIFCHSLKAIDLAHAMNRECRTLWLVMMFSSFVVTFAHTRGRGLIYASYFFKILLCLECALWCAFSILRYRRSVSSSRASTEHGALAARGSFLALDDVKERSQDQKPSKKRRDKPETIAVT